MTPHPTIDKTGHVATGPQVHCREFDGELVILDLDGGQYYGLDSIGARMWQALIAGQTPEEVGFGLAEEFDQSAELLVEDCTRFANELVALGLLTPTSP